MKSTLPKMIFSLGSITIASAALLGSVYEMTKDTIAQADMKAKIEAIGNVTPKFDNNPLDEAFACKVEVGTKDSTTIMVYPAKVGGALVGAAVETTTMKGFAGEIKVIYGFDTNGNVVNYKVLKHSETAGLGSKMQMWFSGDNKSRSIINKNPETNDLRVSKDGGEIDGITAATISSRAFLGALNDAYAAYKQYKESGKEGEK